MTTEFKTTFWEDFTIADHFGVEAVKDTFKRAFDSWKSDYRYLTELVIVLNHKIWEYYKKNDLLAMTYNDLWKIADNYACLNLKENELVYFYTLTD